MKWQGLWCRLFGHQRMHVPFTTNRYICRRCGIDLDAAEPNHTARAG
jgi:uncharacterized protein (DUF983 family)